MFPVTVMNCGGTSHPVVMHLVSRPTLQSTLNPTAHVEWPVPRTTQGRREEWFTSKFSLYSAARLILAPCRYCTNRRKKKQNVDCRGPGSCCLNSNGTISIRLSLFCASLKQSYDQPLRWTTPTAAPLINTQRWAEDRLSDGLG